MSNELILYDLPSKGRCRSWSANVWKTRLVLNYKNISYKTQWVPFPEVRDTVAATGVSPNGEKAWTEYSVPLIKFPDGTYLMDSANIAPALEKLHPSPPLHLDLKIHEELMPAFGQAIMPLVPSVAMPEIARSVILECDREWFYADRERKLGASLDELERTNGGDQAWEKARPGFEGIREVLKKYKRDEGPFILGSEPSYGDFMLVAGIHMFSQFPKEKYEKFLSMCEPELGNLYEASKQWIQRDD